MVDIKIKLKETKTKFIFVTVFNTINFALIVMGNIKQPLSISDYFLGLFMANLMLYFIYYCAMKKVHKEPIPCTAYIFGFLTILCAGTGGYLFLHKAKTTRVSPAVSRDMNQSCMIGMYDSHDLWHYLSAFGLLSFLLLLLVIDDGITDKLRTEIPIF